MTPEERARKEIDRRLVEAGWMVQDYASMNIRAAEGIAVREFPLRKGHGTVDSGPSAPPQPRSRSARATPGRPVPLVREAADSRGCSR
ncbi:MAG: hypothetical protein AVDCRST_MAG22-1450 [uncultured Rubrobacteraceae bacterium]|uniref:Uncharacterized protein n=1 Tax=uncultured Rubrobacteraceae bacterium TaxID=349277 RepID=A0A6J4P2J7_9ACTN|nr:MAG: hypothetical protein AVDCRST_MAG22-1450 [uncultured Rubrobacteraceae bacterium]